MGHPEMAQKRASRKTKSPRAFGHPPRQAYNPFRVGVDARVSTQDQQTIPREFQSRRWRSVTERGAL